MPIERAITLPPSFDIYAAHELLVSDSIMLRVTTHDPESVTFNCTRLLCPG
jgi:hypothetical protein